MPDFVMNPFVMDSFRFNKSFCEALDTMDDEQAGELVKAVAHKVFYNRDPDGFFATMSVEAAYPLMVASALDTFTGTRPLRPVEPQL